MGLHLFDQKIRQAFNNAALQYDVLSGLHREIGRELTKKLIVDENCKNILDIGMGTGWFTNRLKTIIPWSNVIGIDFAKGMIEKAKERQGDFHCIQADAHKLPFSNNTFDRITSNLSFQWIVNLPLAFEECHRCLKDSGILSMTMFGYQTFDELFEAIDQSLPSEQRKRIVRLANLEEVKSSLIESGFKDVNVHRELIKAHFPDMVSILKWIRDIGANALTKDLFIGKQLLQQADVYYEKHFHDHLGVVATFEVLWLEAKK